jgi:hypothetical protein
MGGVKKIGERQATEVGYTLLQLEGLLLQRKTGANSHEMVPDPALLGRRTIGRRPLGVNAQGTYPSPTSLT